MASESRKQENQDNWLEEVSSLPEDAGGAPARGYSSEPGPTPAVPEEGPIPLAPGPNVHPAIHVPERDKHVEPTGRSAPGEYTPNDRLMGADR